VTALLKAYYLTQVFKIVKIATEGDNWESVTAFFKVCNIKNVIDTIKDIRSDISKDGLHGVWWKLLQDYIRGFKDLEPSEKSPGIKELRAALAKQFGLEAVESEDVEELLASYCGDIAKAYLQKLGSKAEVATEKEDEIKDIAPR
jgi:hypothetical protein